MRNRILKRPMFRLGGSTENEGIMNGMRKRYQKGTMPEDIDSTYQEGDFNVNPNQPTQGERSGRRFRDFLVQSPNLSSFLTEFGLNLLSQSPTGNIFQTAATAAKEPFQRLQTKRAIGDERDFERELLEKKLDVQREIAAGNDKEYDMAYKLGLEKFENPALAKNFAEYYTTIQPTVAAQFGATQVGGLIEQDVSVQKNARQLGKTLDKQGKLNKIFYDVYTGSFKRLVKEQGNYKFVPVAGSANVTDPEGTTIPEATETDKRKEYIESIKPGLKEFREKKREELLEKRGLIDEGQDVDI